MFVPVGVLPSVGKHFSRPIFDMSVAGPLKETETSFQVYRDSESLPGFSTSPIAGPVRELVERVSMNKSDTFPGRKLEVLRDQTNAKNVQKVKAIVKPNPLKSTVIVVTTQSLNDYNKDNINDGYQEIVKDAVIHLRQLEKINRPSSTYMYRHRDFDVQTRALLVDWIVEIIEIFSFVPETLYLSVNYIDRVMSKKHVPRHRLQLLGLTAVFIAAKYEEVRPCLLTDILEFSEHTVTRDDVKTMEFIILESLQYGLNCATIHVFCTRYLDEFEFLHSQEQRGSDKVAPLATFLNELSLLHSGMLAFSPSMIALSSIVLALHTLHLPYWHPCFQEYTGYLRDQLVVCVEHLHWIHSRYCSWGYEQSMLRFSHKSRMFVSSLIPRSSPPSLAII